MEELYIGFWFQRSRLYTFCFFLRQIYLYYFIKLDLRFFNPYIFRHSTSISSKNSFYISKFTNFRFIWIFVNRFEGEIFRSLSFRFIRVLFILWKNYKMDFTICKSFFIMQLPAFIIFIPFLVIYLLFVISVILILDLEKFLLILTIWVHFVYFFFSLFCVYGCNSHFLPL